MDRDDAKETTPAMRSDPPTATTRSVLPLTVVVALLLQSAISAGTHIAVKQGGALMPPLLLVVLRLVLAAAAFALVLLALPRPRLPPRTWWPWLLGYGLLTGPINQGLFMYGLSRSKATHGALLYALTPIGVYLLGVARGKEALSWRRGFGIALAFSGVLVLLLGRGLSELSGPLVGDVFILGAVVAWVLWTAEAQSGIAEFGGLRTAAWSIIAGGLWALPVAPFFISAESLADIPQSGWWLLGYLVVMTSMLAYALWNFALARVEPSRVAVFANLQPVATAVAAAVFLGESLVWEVGVGGVLVLVGLRITQSSR
jgi:drug/metabolite transporter (DMT)-like permease